MQLKSTMNWLLGEGSSTPTKAADIKKGYTPMGPSFSDRLAFVDFCDEKNLFLLNDGVSVGSGFELGDIPAEATSPQHLKSVFDKVCDTFTRVVPLHQKDPWVMQMYVSDEYSLNPVLEHMKQAIAPEILNTAFTQDYLERVGDLFQKMTRPQGLFVDPKTGSAYRGRRRRIRVLFYRRYTELTVSREEAVLEHEEVISQIKTKLISPGLSLKRLTGKSYYTWWMKWFNPSPSLTDGDCERLVQQFPYPKDKKPASFSFPQNIVFSPVESDEKGFVFDGIKHRVLYVDGLKESPEIGLISRERPQANPKHRYALLDKLPEGSIYTLSVVFSSDESLDAHLMRIDRKSVV